MMSQVAPNQSTRSLCSRPANLLRALPQRAPARRCRSVRPARLQAFASADASTVKLTVQGRHLTVTPAMEMYTRERLTNVVGKFEGGVKEVIARLSAAGGDRGTGAKRQRVEITVYTLRNGIVRAEDTEDSMYAAIDLVADKVKQSLRKMKEKAIARGKWAGSGGPHGHSLGEEVEMPNYEVMSDSESEEEEDIYQPGPKMEVVRTKEVKLLPVTLEDAVEELELTDHDFHLFQELETGRVQLVYRRREGGVGLIKPTLVQDL
mmetsp:Transcript_6705/g.19291  ORF Transcript_6705/g.19291 Transcript_6705/m.19291 type:complete len:263 (-) Transcript_6705:1949-2737(-)